MILDFGKHRGKFIHEVPRSYLRWLNEQPWFAEEHPFLADHVRRLLGTSETAQETRQQQQPASLMADTLKTWRRAVLTKWHPDRAGGSHAAFIAVSDAVDSLASMLAAKGVSA
jgi:hypothetical protein